MYNIIASGSKGNAIVYHDEILVDVGVAYKHIEPFLNKIKYILLTHRHSDHYKKKIVQRIQKNYPTIIFIGCQWFEDVEDITVIQCNTWYQLEGYQIASFNLMHDVENVGYRIFKELPDFEHHKTFHATDMNNLDGIEAVGYDLYMMEQNHCAIKIDKVIQEKQDNGVFSHELYSKLNHMSNQKADDWLDVNNTKGAKVVPLHISATAGTRGGLDE